MIDLRYKATSEAELLAAIPSYMFTLNDLGETVLQKHSHDWAWDWDIPFVITEAVMDGTTVVTPAVMSTEFYASLRLLDESADVSSLSTFIEAEQPNRDWSNGD